MTRNVEAQIDRLREIVGAGLGVDPRTADEVAADDKATVAAEKQAKTDAEKAAKP